MSRGIRLRGLRIVLGLTAAATLIHAGSAGAQGSATPSLGGYQGTAQADGLHAFYNPQGLLPIAPPLDLGAPDALATIASGPATFARASAADPGDLLANPDALLQTGVSGWKPGTIPAYPYRATASTGTQADDESSPAPGLDARAHADSNGSAALATMPATNTPAVATFGTMSSTATTHTDGSTVTLHARSEISDLNVLGLVTIGSIITDLTSTSDGTTTSVSGGTIVSNAAVLGTPVQIDAGGVRAAPGDTTTTTSLLGGLLGSLLTPTVGSVNDLLANAGMHITVAGPVQSGDDKAGLLVASGLRIDFELSEQTFPALKMLLDSLPFIENPIPGAPSVADIITVLEARHLVSLEVARGMVSLTARPSQPFTAAPTSPSTPSTGSGATGGGATTGRPASSVGSPSIAAAPAAAPLAEESTSPSIGVGIGVAALLVLLLQPLLGYGAARATEGLLADDLASCPWEER